MFVALKSLLGHCVSLSVSITQASDGNMTVTVIPKPKLGGEGAQSLSTPLVLTGTAEELDTEFVNLVSQYSGSHKSLAEQVEATNAILEAAKKDSQGKAVKAVKKSPESKGSNSEKPKASAQDTGSEEEDENEETGQQQGGTEPVSTEGASAAAPASGGVGSLWE